MSGGRNRTKYKDWLEPDKLLLVEAWARDGLSNEQIANNMGIGLTAFYDWQKKYTDFAEAIKRSKDIVDIEVENALLKRAIGYSYTEVTKELVLDKETGERKLVVTKTVKKDVPPDVGAQCFWLKNRKPEMWRDRRELELDADIEVEMSLEEKAKLIATLAEEFSDLGG